MNNEDYIKELKKEIADLREELIDKKIKLKIAIQRYERTQELYFEYLTKYGILNKKDHSIKKQL